MNIFRRATQTPAVAEEARALGAATAPSVTIEFRSGKKRRFKNAKAMYDGCGIGVQFANGDDVWWPEREIRSVKSIHG